MDCLAKAISNLRTLKEKIFNLNNISLENAGK